MKIFKNKKGYSLAEIMIVVAILGTVASVAPIFFTKVFEFFSISQSKATIQRDTRAALDIMNRNLREAEQDSIKVDRESNTQPPYSRVSFNKVNDSTQISYYQMNDKLMMRLGIGSRVLCENLRYVCFSFPRTDDLSIISVSITVEKTLAKGQKKAIHVAIEKVRIMNE